MENNKMILCILLVHQNLGMFVCESNNSNHYLNVQLFFNSEMSLWDLSDSRCIETVKHQYIHTNIQTYVMNDDEVRFFCNGYYSEIFIIDGLTLETLFTLNSKLNPDWISAIHVLRSPKTQGLF